MIFVYPITVPANTPATAPVKTLLQLGAGVIQRVDLQFPSGCLALVHFAVTDGLHQLWPANSESDFASDRETIQWDDQIVLAQPPYQLFASAFNLDTLNAHTVTLRIFITPQLTVLDLAAQISLLVGNPGG